MSGPFPLDRNSINAAVTKTSPGVYSLGTVGQDGQFYVYYVGRADDDLKTRLLAWPGNSPRTHFMASYAESPAVAYHEECRCYHEFNPPDNKIHPDLPAGYSGSCSHCPPEF